jgi:hypothetical protein
MRVVRFLSHKGLKVIFSPSQQLLYIQIPQTYFVLHPEILPPVSMIYTIHLDSDQRTLRGPTGLIKTYMARHTASMELGQKAGESMVGA